MNRSMCALVGALVLLAPSCKRSSRAPLTDGGGAAVPPSMGSRLLQLDDVSSFLSDPVSAKRLAGIPESPAYSSMRYYPKDGLGENYGIGVQVWILGGKASGRYVDDLGIYPVAVAKDEVGTRSFRAYRDRVMYEHFLDQPTGTVVSISCGASTCSPDSEKTATRDQLSWARIIGIAKTVQARLPAVTGGTHR